MADATPLLIPLGFNTETAIKDAQKLSREVQAFFSKVDMGSLDSKSLAFIKNLTAATNRMDKLVRSAQELAHTQIPTEEYAYWEKELQRAEKAFDKVIQKQNALREQAHITDSNDPATIGIKVSQQGARFETSWKNAEAHAEALNQQISIIKQEMGYLVHEGEAFKLGKDTDKFKEINNNLNVANQEVNLLLQKYSEINNISRDIQRRDGAGREIRNGRGMRPGPSIGSEVKRVDFANKNGEIISTQQVEEAEERITGVANRLRHALQSLLDAFKLDSTRAEEERLRRDGDHGDIGGGGGTGGDGGGGDDDSRPRRIRGEIRSLSDTLKEFCNEAKKKFLNVLHKLGSAFKTLHNHLRGSARSHNDFGMSMKRHLLTLMRYTLGIRSIFMLVRRVRGYIKEAFKVMAQEIPEVNKDLSQLGHSFKELKAGFGTMLQPVLKALTPILDTILQKILSLMNAIGRFFATLSGQDYVYEATVANYDYAESVKEAENSLASFDKLNVISKTKNDLSLTPDTVTYKKVKINPEDKWYTKLAEEIKKGWEKADLTDATHGIAEKLATWLDGIKWDEIKQKSKKFSGMLATGINGITLPDPTTGKSHLAESIGSTIGNAIDWAIENINEFVTKLDWEALGDFIATAIDKLKETLADNDSWRKAGEAFGKLFQGVVDLGFKLFVDGNIFEGLGESISTMIGKMVDKGMEIKPGTNMTYFEAFGEMLSKGIIDLLDELEILIDKSGADLVKAVNHVFLGIETTKLFTTLARVLLKGLFLGIKLVVSAGLGALGIQADEGTVAFIAEALGIGLLGIKIAKLISNITGSGGLLSAFKKKDQGLQKQGRALAAEALAVAAVTTGLGWLTKKALDTSPSIGSVTASVEDNTQAAQDLTGALGQSAQSYEDLATAGAMACESLKQDVQDAMTEVTTDINTATFALPEVDTSSYSNVLAATQQTITLLEQMWANANLGADVTVKGGTTHGEIPGKAPAKSVSLDSEGNPVVSTGKPSTTTQVEVTPHEGAPYYELIQQGAKAQKDYIAQRNYDNFVYTINSLSESSALEVFGSFCKLAKEKGFNDFTEVFADNIAYDDILTQIGNASRRSANIKKVGVQQLGILSMLFGGTTSWAIDEFKSTKWADDIEKALKNFLKWSPVGAGGGMSIPLLGFAQGTVIPPTMAPFLGVLGDNNREAEVVSPLSTIEQAVRNVLAEQNINVTFDVQGDPNKIFKVVQRQAKSYNRRTHSNAFGGV